MPFGSRRHFVAGLYSHVTAVVNTLATCNTLASQSNYRFRLPSRKPLLVLCLLTYGALHPWFDRAVLQQSWNPLRSEVDRAVVERSDCVSLPGIDLDVPPETRSSLPLDVGDSGLAMEACRLVRLKLGQGPSSCEGPDPACRHVPFPSGGAPGNRDRRRLQHQKGCM